MDGGSANHSTAINVKKSKLLRGIQAYNESLFSYAAAAARRLHS